MLYLKIKEIICHGLEWNYNDIDVEITQRCQISEQQYYIAPIVCDGSFKIMKYSFIQNGLNMMILYVSNRSKLISVSISVGPLNSVGKDKIDLLLDDLM